MIRGTIKPGGDLEITLGVEPSEKWEAFSLTDADGVMVFIDAVRVPLRGEEDGLED